MIIVSMLCPPLRRKGRHPMTEFLFPTQEQALLYLRTAGYKPMRECNWINHGTGRAASVKAEPDCTRVVVIMPNG